MDPKHILEAITTEVSVGGGIMKTNVISAQKLAAFLAKHLAPTRDNHS